MSDWDFEFDRDDVSNLDNEMVQLIASVNQQRVVFEVSYESILDMFEHYGGSRFGEFKKNQKECERRIERFVQKNLSTDSIPSLVRIMSKRAFVFYDKSSAEEFAFEYAP